MKLAAALLLCVGCIHPTIPDCMTAGGLRVFGVDDCTELSRAQEIVERESGQLFPVGWSIHVTGMQGLTNCEAVWITVDERPLGQSAFFHEAFHVFDRCTTPNHEGWNEPGAQRDQWVHAAQTYEAETK